MRRTSTILVLIALSKEVLGRVAPRHVSVSSVVPVITHWESLKGNTYGTTSPVPLPNSPPWREDSCESELNTDTPTPSSSTSPSISPSNAIPGVTSLASHLTSTLSLQSRPTLTFICSPLPSASPLASNTSTPSPPSPPSTPTFTQPLVPIVETSGLVVYPHYPTSSPVGCSTPAILTGLDSSIVHSGTVSLGTSTRVSSTVSPTAPVQQSSLAPVPAASVIASSSSLFTGTVVVPIPITVSSTISTSPGSSTVASSSAPSAAVPSVVSTSLKTLASTTSPSLSSAFVTTVVPTASGTSNAPSASASSIIAPSVSQPSSIRTTLSTDSTPAQASSSTNFFPTAPPYSYNPSASRASISASPSTSEPSSYTTAGSSANTSGLPTPTPSPVGTQGTSIPTAPIAAGESGGMTKSKEKVWWLLFCVPLLFAL